MDEILQVIEEQADIIETLNARVKRLAELLAQRYDVEMAEGGQEWTQSSQD
jgi:hypothetical protein